MSEIRAGDLVMVVRGHACMLAHAAGIPFVVDAIGHDGLANWRCSRCGAEKLGTFPRYVRFRGAHVPLEYLLRIDPPATIESIPIDEELEKPVRESIRG